MSELRLTTFGEALLLRSAGSARPSVVLASSKPLALLVYLHCSPTRSARKDQLTDLLWSDLSPDSARHALRQAVWYTRQRLGFDCLDTTAATITLTNGFASDWNEFWRSLENDDAETAVAVYGGEFFSRFAMPGAVEFEDWLDIERHRLRRAFVGAVETVARARLAIGENKAARDVARRAHSVEPEQQALHRLLLETLVAVGDRISALAEAEALIARLKEQGREPDPATKRIMTVVREDSQVALRRDGTNATDVGTLWADLVGREREFGAILDAWQRASNGRIEHVHVTGAAGLGKTRLLDDVASRLRSIGAAVVKVGAKAANRSISYALASELAEHLARLPAAPGVSPDSATALVALNPALSSRFPTQPDRSTREEALRRRSIAVAEMIAAVADEKPLVILIDDLHWADKPSRDLIHSACSNSDLKHVLCITAARPHPVLDEATSAAVCLELHALTSAQVEAIVVSLGALPDEPWSLDLAQHLYECTGGSPLLVLETLLLALERDLLALTDSGWACSDSAALWTELVAGGALRTRISQLDGKQRRLLLLLAVAGTPLSGSQLELMLARGPNGTVPKLDTLVQRGFVTKIGDSWIPSHDEIAQITVELATAEELEAAHLAVGRAFARQGTADTQALTIAARHLAEGRDTAELETVFTTLVGLARSRRDERTAAQLASELLGDAARPQLIAELVQALPLNMRVQRRTKRLAFAALLVAVVVTITVVAGILTSTRTPADAELLLLGPATSNAFPMRSIRLNSENWDPQRPIELDGSSEDLTIAIETQPFGSFGLTQLGGDVWLTSYVFPDSGGAEVVLLGTDGSMERLTFSPGDDGPFDWSPDGSTSYSRPQGGMQTVGTTWPYSTSSRSRSGR